MSFCPEKWKLRSQMNPLDTCWELTETLIGCGRIKYFIIWMNAAAAVKVMDGIYGERLHGCSSGNILSVSTHISWKCRNVLKISVTIYRCRNNAYARNHKVTSFRIISVRTSRLWLSFVTKMSITWGTECRVQIMRTKWGTFITLNTMFCIAHIPCHCFRFFCFLWDVKCKGVKKQNLQISQFYICWFSISASLKFNQSSSRNILLFICSLSSISYQFCLKKTNKDWLLSDRHYQLLFIVWQRKFLGKD